MKRKSSLILMIAFAFASLLLYMAAVSLGELLKNAVKFEIISGLLFLLSLSAYFVARRAVTFDRRMVIIIISAAFLFRLIMAVTPPTLSNDIYRYAWDGRVQLAGQSPYLHTPSDPDMRELRPEDITKLQQNYTSIAVYQPAAQLLFFASAPAGDYSIFVIKGVLALFDIGTIFLILGILSALKRQKELIILYAWSPLIVFEIAGSGHIDGLAAFFTTGAVYLAIKGSKYFAGSLGGLGFATKLYPGIVLPALSSKARAVKPLIGAGAAMAATYIPYMLWGGSILLVGGTISNASIAGGPAFNQGLKAVVVWICGGPGAGVDNAYAILAAFSMIVAAFYYWTKEKTKHGMVRTAFWLTSLLTILLPYTVPWYFAIALPFAIIERSWSMIYLSGSVMLAYIFYAGNPWALPAWVQIVEYVPFFVLLMIDLKRLSPMSTTD